MKTPVFKLEVMVIDFDECGLAGVISAIETARYPNRCISPKVIQAASTTVDWSDDHPLNKKATWRQTYDKLFEEGKK